MRTLSRQLPRFLSHQVRNLYTMKIFCLGASRMPIMIKSEEDAVKYAKSIKSDKICPIFCVSNVTGVGIDFVKLFMSKL